MSFAGKWMDQENPILNEVTKIQKDRQHTLFFIGNS